MKAINKVMAIFITAILFLSFFKLGLASEKRTKEERSNIASRLLCEHSFPFAITYLELTPNGYIHAVARDGKGKKATLSRYLIDESCRQFWKGSESNTALFADDPNPAILDVAQTGFVLRSITASGSERWVYNIPGIPASSISDSDTKTLVMMIMPYEWGIDPSKAYPAKIVGVDLTSGVEIWSTDVGDIEGSIDSFGGELDIWQGGAWWAAGGRAFRVNLADGKLSWNSAVKNVSGSDSLWRFSSDGAVVARGGFVAAFSDTDGLLWQQELPGGVNPRGLSWTAAGIVGSFASEKKFNIVLFDAVSGRIIWNKDMKHNTKKYGAPPSGLAASDDRVAFFANEEVIGLELPSGNKAYQHKLKSKKFLSISEIREGKSGFIVVGTTGAVSFSLNDGSELWQELDFVDPIFEVRKQRMAVMQLGMSSAAQLITAPGAEKAWKEYRSGSRNFTSAAQEAAFQQHMFVQQMGESGRAIGKGIGKMVEIDLTLVNRRLSPSQAEFYRHRGGNFMFLKVVNDLDAALLDLDSGKSEDVGLSKTKDACVSQMLIDPVSRKVIQAFRQMALMCKDENRIEIYGY